MGFLDPVDLAGDHVVLRPLVPADADGLAAAAADGELWTLQYTAVPEPAGVDGWVAARLADRAAGTMLPFTVRTPAGRVVGATTYCHADAATPRVEIGYTWYSRSVQRSGLNTEAKLLLLTHALDVWECTAVEFRTHFLNRSSRAAIERLGARRDGVLRSHQRMADGTLRDTVVYSITAYDWPAIRAELRRRLAAGRASERAASAD